MASVYTHSKLFKQRSFYTQQAFTQRSFYTQQAFTHSKGLHIEHLRTMLLHMASVYTHRNFYTETLLHTEKLLHTTSLYRNLFAQRSFLVHNHNRNCSSKTGSRCQSDKKTILKHFLKIFLKENYWYQNWENLLTNHCRSLHAATPIQPLQYDLRSSAAKNNSITHAAAAPSNLDAATTMRSAETELQNTIELRTRASEIAAPKPDLDARAKKRRFWSTF